MNEFVNSVIRELKTNESLKNEALVKMLVESADKSINLGENVATVYSSLKDNLSKINEHLKSSNISVILEQFSAREYSDVGVISQITASANLGKRLNAIKKSVGVNPIILTKIAQFEAALNEGANEVSLYGSFISVFEAYLHNDTIATQVNSLKKYINENRSMLLALTTVFEMEKFPMYKSAVEDLRKMIINETYNADILKVRFNGEIPAINNLVSDLRIIESEQLGYFTLGEGNTDTKVSNVIAPAFKTNEGALILLHDNRFLSISESKKLSGAETDVHINENFKIATINPEHIKSTYSNFYKACESYSALGFKPTENGMGVESTSIRNFKIGFRVNENKSIDLYLNNAKIDSPESIIIDEALAMENSNVVTHVKTVFKNLSNIFNFEFIKEVKNDRTLAESIVFNLKDKYYVCEKLNSYERAWNNVSEHQMYDFFISKYQYDISPIFKVKINESVEKIKKIEAKKSSILTDIEKLQVTISKLDESLASKELEREDYTKLTSIKSDLENVIVEMKQDYISQSLKGKSLINEDEMPAAGSNGYEVADLSDKVKNLFLPTSTFWAPYKGAMNDDEPGALEAFKNWWNSEIQPALNQMEPLDSNVKSLLKAYAEIQERILGGSSSDTVSWIIYASYDGRHTQLDYEVDTDF